MQRIVLWFSLATLACASPGTLEDLATLLDDDECTDASCAVNALQLRGVMESDGEHKGKKSSSYSNIMYSDSYMHEKQACLNFLSKMTASKPPDKFMLGFREFGGVARDGSYIAKTWPYTTWKEAAEHFLRPDLMQTVFKKNERDCQDEKSAAVFLPFREDAVYEMNICPRLEWLVTHRDVSCIMIIRNSGAASVEKQLSWFGDGTIEWAMFSRIIDAHDRWTPALTKLNQKMMSGGTVLIENDRGYKWAPIFSMRLPSVWVEGTQGVVPPNTCSIAFNAHLIDPCFVGGKQITKVWAHGKNMGFTMTQSVANQVARTTTPTPQFDRAAACKPPWGANQPPPGCGCGTWMAGMCGCGCMDLAAASKLGEDYMNKMRKR